MGSKKSVTIGYRYYMGIHMGLGRGPVDELVEIEVGGKKAWQGSVTGNQSVTIAKPNLFGGDKKEGGINGTLQVLMGGPTQTAPSGLASMLGGDVPGFRGFVSLFFDGQVSAMNPYIKPWKFRVRRSTAGWDGEAWYPTKAKIELSAGAIHAMNPAHIVYECLTNRDWGGGMDRSRLDDASFRAAADALYAEGFGLCLRWNRGDAVSDFVQEVLDHIGGNLYLSRFDGLFHLTLIRDDYDAASLPLFDEDSGLLGVDEDDNSASAGALNEIVVKWHDPISNESRSWRERNLGAVRADGQVLSESKSYAGLPTAELAGRVAVRELRAASAGLKRFKVRLDRRGYRIEPGQPFRIRSLKRGIESMVVRAGRIEDGRLDDATITITAVQDVFGLPASSMTAVQPSGWTPPDATPQAIGVRRLLERTWRDIAQDTDPANLELIDPTACYLQALAVKPTALSQGYAMQVRVGSSEWTEADDGGDFCPSGLLVAALGPADTAFTLTSGSDLDFVTPGGAALIGDEIVRVDSFDHTTLSGTLGRGCVDTVPASHPAGTRLWFVEDARALEPAAYSPGTTVQARLLTQTSQGQLDPALAATDSLTLLGRQGRPYPPGQLRINGESYPANVTGDVVLTWAHRDRLLQADQLIDTAIGSVGPEAGVTYSTRLLKAVDGVELVSDTDISGTTATLSTAYEGGVIAELWSVRGGLESHQRQRHQFMLGEAHVDPHRANVVAHLHFDGAGGGTNFYDTTGRVWAAQALSGQARVDTSWAQFGPSSLIVDGGGRIQTSDAAELRIGAQDFTIELFCRPAEVADRYYVLAAKDDLFDREWILLIDRDAGRRFVFAMFTAGGTFSVQSTTIPTEGSAYYLRVVRSGGTLSMHVNSTVEGITSVGSAAANATTQPLTIGSYAGPNDLGWRGHIDEARFTIGTGRQTPGVPDGPFPNS